MIKPKIFDSLDLMSPKFHSSSVYYVFRNGVQISSNLRGIEFIGIKKYYQGKLVIDFYEKQNILVGDSILEVDTKVKYIVTDIEMKSNQKSFIPDQLEYFYAFIVNEFEYNQNKSINIVAGDSSIVSVNSQNVIMNNYSSITQLIETCSPEDQAIGYELIEVLKNMENKDSIKKNSLQKFSDFLLKYSPIAIAVGQLLVSIFTK